MSETVTIIDNRTGKRLECPVRTGTYGAPVIDTSALYRELGMFTLDPGYGTTASCRSAITYLDGDEGILLHRGYPIEQLAEHSDYLETAYLIIHGDLFEARGNWNGSTHQVRWAAIENTQMQHNWGYNVQTSNATV